MPLLVDDSEPLGFVGRLPEAAAEGPRPDFLGEALPSAFRLDNTVGATVSREPIPPLLRGIGGEGFRRLEPDFDPFADVEGYEEHAFTFAAANTPDEVAAIKRQIDRERADRDTLARSGWAGVAASLASGLLDPVNLLPVGGAAYRAYATGGSILRSGLVTARAGFVGSTAAEAALHSQQETRTWGESAANVAAATFLSGVLGTAVPAVRRALGKGARSIEDRVARDMEVPPLDRPDLHGPGALRVTPEELAADVAVERDALGRAYDQVRAEPAGPALDPLVRITPRDIEETVVARGGWQGLGDVEVEGAGWGLVKFIWRHGEASDKAPETQVRREDVLDFPRVAREFEPIIERGEEAGTYRLWAVERQDGRQLVYVDRPFEDGRRVVSIRVSEDTARKPMSGPRAEAEGAGAPGSPAGVRSPDRDTPRGVNAPLAEGQAAPALEPAPGNVGPDGATGKAALIEPTGEGGSVGAATRPTVAEEKLKSAFGLEKAVAFASPVLRLATSPSIETRRVTQELVESPFFYDKNALGVASEIAVETRVKMWSAPLGRAIEALERSFVRYRTGAASGSRRRIALADLARPGRRAGKLAWSEFKDEVGRAMRRGDESDIPEVAEAARELRRLVFDPLKDRAIAAKLLPEDVTPETAVSYLSRVWNTRKINARRPELVRITVDWLSSLREIANRRLAEGEKNLAGVEGRGRTLADELTFTEGELRLTLADLKKARLDDAAVERDVMAAERELREAEGEARVIAERAGWIGADTPKAQARAAEIELQRRRAEKRQAKAGERLAKATARREAVTAALDEARESGAGLKGRVADLGQAKRQASAQAEVLRRRRDEDAAFGRAEDVELQDIAQQIIDRIVATPNGRVHYDAVPIKNAPALKERTFTIPDELVEGFLESDVELVARFYTRTMAPDVELAERFGRADLQEQIAKVTDDYARKQTAAKTEAERERLGNRRDADIRDLAAMRDRLRGTYAAPADPNALLSRVGQGMRHWNYIRMLGGMTVSAIPDLARPVMTEGFMRVAGSGLVPLVRNLRAFKLAGREVQLAGTAWDMVLDTRALSIADIGDDYGRYSKFERGLQAASNRFGVVSLMAPWNQVMKQFAGVVTQARILDDVARLAAGALGRRGVERLAMGGIGDDLARRIAGQFSRHGETVDGVRIAHTEDWNDREAIEAFRAAIVKETDRTIVTPGIGDRPLWMSSEIGKMVGQFRSFSFAAVQRVTISGLQQRDMAALNGALLSVALGMMVYAVKGWQAGIELSDDPRQWLAEGVDRSGLVGWLFDANNIVEKATRGTVGINALIGGPTMSRYASRNLEGAVLGPTLGLMAESAGVVGSLATGQWTATDTRALRRLVPYQNVFYIRGLFDAAERGINHELGVETRQ